MMIPSLEQFSLAGKTAIVTGGSGVLGAAICAGLAAAGAKVAVLARRAEAVDAVVAALHAQGGQATGALADVNDADSLRAAAAHIEAALGPVDILVNAAGGNKPEATATPGARTFFDLPIAAIDEVFRLNFAGTVLPCQVFGAGMAARGQGSIINISSMAALRPLTRVVAYAGAKAAINNFTQWLAVALARDFSPAIRVNALAPGFFLGEQNRFLLTDASTGALTPRGQTIIDHTPMARFGTPDDLIGALVWLASDAARFVTGIVVPIDGGFSAFSGV